MNWQNIPRDLLVVKRAVIPKLDVLVFFDYDGIEMRLLAYYMALGVDDHSLVEEFKAGLDPHAETAKLIYDLDRTPTKSERQVGKGLNFSVIYGGGRPTITRQLGVSWEEAGKLLKDFHNARPGIREVQESILDSYRRRGYIRTLWGRRLHPQEDHKALNALIQGCAADLMKAALVKLHGLRIELSLESHMILVIHDEVGWDACNEEVRTLLQRVPLLMGDERLQEVIPIEVGIELSTTSWADKRPIEEVDLAALVPDPPLPL